MGLVDYDTDDGSNNGSGSEGEGEGEVVLQTQAAAKVNPYKMSNPTAHTDAAGGVGPAPPNVGVVPKVKESTSTIPAPAPLTGGGLFGAIPAPRSGDDLDRKIKKKMKKEKKRKERELAAQNSLKRPLDEGDAAEENAPKKRGFASFLPAPKQTIAPVKRFQNNPYEAMRKNKPKKVSIPTPHVEDAAVYVGEEPVEVDNDPVPGVDNAAQHQSHAADAFYVGDSDSVPPPEPATTYHQHDVPSHHPDAQSGAQIVDISADDLRGPVSAAEMGWRGVSNLNPEDARVQAMVGGPSAAASVSKVGKRRHQITALAANAQERVLEFEMKRAAGMKSKRETQAKYGW